MVYLLQMVDLSMAMLNNQMVISPISPLSHDHTPKFCDVHLTVFFGPVAGAAVAQHRTPGSMRPRGKFGPWTAMTATPKNWLVTILLMNRVGKCPQTSPNLWYHIHQLLFSGVQHHKKKVQQGHLMTFTNLSKWVIRFTIGFRSGAIVMSFWHTNMR